MDAIAGGIGGKVHFGIPKTDRDPVNDQRGLPVVGQKPRHALAGDPRADRGEVTGQGRVARIIAACGDNNERRIDRRDAPRRNFG